MSSTMSEITILGAYGTKGESVETSSFLIDEQNVIDAGNLLRSMGEKCAAIENIWLTHSHLDHIIDIAYVLDSYFAQRKKPLRLRGLPETLEAIRTHFLNNQVWPDFSRIALLNQQEMSVIYEPIEIAKRYDLGNGTTMEAFKTDHTVPSCGYVVTKAQHAVAITADTYALDGLLELLESNRQIRSLVIECSFPNEMDLLAKQSKHLTPALLFGQINTLDSEQYRLYINHIKPLYEARISAEIAVLKGTWEAVLLKDGDKIQF